MQVYTIKLPQADGSSGWSCVEMDCEDDDDALERAASLHHVGPIEIWHGERLVWRFEERFGR